MTPVDWIALAVVVGSMAVGLMRGLIREVISLAAWIAAFFIASAFSPMAATYIPGSDHEGLHHLAAGIIIFILVLVLAQLVATLLNKLVKISGLGALNNTLGMLFGAGRGVVILVLLTLGVGYTALPRSPAWKHSLVGAPLVLAAQKIIPWLPKDLAASIRFK